MHTTDSESNTSPATTSPPPPVPLLVCSLGMHRIMAHTTDATCTPTPMHSRTHTRTRTHQLPEDDRDVFEDEDWSNDFSEGATLLHSSSKPLKVTGIQADPSQIEGDWDKDFDFVCFFTCVALCYFRLSVCLSGCKLSVISVTYAHAYLPPTHTHAQQEPASNNNSKNKPAAFSLPSRRLKLSRQVSVTLMTSVERTEVILKDVLHQFPGKIHYVFCENAVNRAYITRLQKEGRRKRARGERERKGTERERT